MLDQETTATTGTIWQDNHSGLRRHKLMTKELADTIPPLYANDGADDPDAVVARVTAVSTRPPDVDCAAALDLTDQDPTINQMMASLVLQVVRRMAAGTCPFMGLYLDMEQGTVTPTYATPETVARVARSDSEPGMAS